MNLSSSEWSWEEWMDLEPGLVSVMNVDYGCVFTAVTAGQETVLWLPQVGERELWDVSKKLLKKNIHVPAKKND